MTSSSYIQGAPLHLSRQDLRRHRFPARLAVSLGATLTIGRACEVEQLLEGLRF